MKKNLEGGKFWSGTEKKFWIVLQLKKKFVLNDEVKFLRIFRQNYEMGKKFLLPIIVGRVKGAAISL